MQTIHNYSDFCRAVRQVGFTMGWGAGANKFTLGQHFGPGIAWHTGDPETDPWEWRIRCVTECDDIAYGKFFTKLGGWMSREWVPLFMSVRRRGMNFDELYQSGGASRMEKEVYSFVQERNAMPLHGIRAELGVPKEDKSRFERAITNLQQNMYLCICGSTQKRNRHGEPYGWPVTTFCTIEQFFGDEMNVKMAEISPSEARVRISEQIETYYPGRDNKTVQKFIG